MNAPDLIKWLYKNSGDIIKHKLNLEYGIGEKIPKKQLYNNPEVKKWVNNIVTIDGNFPIHGYFDSCLENILGKLSQFGLHKDDAPLRGKFDCYYNWLKRESNDTTPIDILLKTITAVFLAKIGYDNDELVFNAIKQRLDDVYKAAVQDLYDIFEPDENYEVPIFYENYKLIKKSVYPEGHFYLPWIYDFYGFALFKDKLDPVKLDAVLAYVMNKNFQKLPFGYGLIINPAMRYHYIGWSAHFPNCSDPESSSYGKPDLIQRLAILASFIKVRDLPWFKVCLNFLRQYQKREGTFRFPAYVIQEKPSTYFVNGTRMGLGENRKDPKTLDIESTYWMLELIKKMEN